MDRKQLAQIAEIQGAATDQQIAEAENELGIKFPEEYRLLLTASDGLFANDLNRSRKDWHRQFLFGNTVFVQKTVPRETVCAFDYRT